jgi:predicted helicase
VKEGIDALATPQSDLDFQVSTDPASVRRFLDAPFAGVKLIFSTYQSASVMGVAMPPGEAFDFAVFDEAHKTAGREGRNFACALDDKKLSMHIRLFFSLSELDSLNFQSKMPVDLGILNIYRHEN